MEKTETLTARAKTRKYQELMMFLFLTVFLAPAVAIGLVGGYGLLVWIYQLVVGPPGS